MRRVHICAHCVSVPVYKHYLPMRIWNTPRLVFIRACGLIGIGLGAEVEGAVLDVPLRVGAWNSAGLQKQSRRL